MNCGTGRPPEITTRERQEQAVVDAWERLSVAGGVENRRLLAALHYFHVACRLSRQASAPGEFLSEALLNLCKALGVLFPASGDGLIREAVRARLTDLGYSAEEIERDFVPAMALRSYVDVAHVELALFTPAQLAVLHAYAEHAESAFRGLMQRLLERISSGAFAIEPYQFSRPDTDVKGIIERIRNNLPKDAL